MRSANAGLSKNWYQPLLVFVYKIMENMDESVEILLVQDQIMADRVRSDVYSFIFEVKNINKLQYPIFLPPVYVGSLVWTIIVMPSDGELFYFIFLYFSLFLLLGDEPGLKSLGFYFCCNGDSPSWACNVRTELHIFNKDNARFFRSMKHKFHSKENNFDSADLHSESNEFNGYVGLQNQGNIRSREFLDWDQCSGVQKPYKSQRKSNFFVNFFEKFNKNFNS
jgi:hypothetical protein